ncbi:MAG TPA: hypothetical protein IAB44_07820 [Candidatus Limivivens intestinipullorum]|uniref:ATPase n=1 Tax=Candidatus Limivivens intestinipullorum TaxID=2840858 RepID=A0A9D1ET36_9FIRM|nr:hypothetical protein [Candidatus Limivivens intestinipullorum]
MDEVVKRLSAIETEAVHIMEETARQKKELEEQSQERIRKYKEAVDAKTAEELSRLQTELEEQKQKSLEKLRQDTLKELDALEKDYAANHKDLVDQVMARLIER